MYGYIVYNTIYLSILCSHILIQKKKNNGMRQVIFLSAIIILKETSRTTWKASRSNSTDIKLFMRQCLIDVCYIM